MFVCQLDFENIKVAFGKMNVNAGETRDTVSLLTGLRETFRGRVNPPVRSKSSHPRQMYQLQMPYGPFQLSPSA